MNEIGYKNLVKLTSFSNTEGFYYRPRITMDMLKKYSMGLAFGSACIGGILGRDILAGEIRVAERTIRTIMELSRNKFYIEFMPNELNEQRMLNTAYISLQERTGCPVIATIDAHY